MKTVVGLWIEYRKAIVVTLAGEGDREVRIVSNVEKQCDRPKEMDSPTSCKPAWAQADERQLRACAKHLNAFYGKVLSCVRDAESVLIFGPGDAKAELKEVMEHSSHHGRVMVMESADSMTDRQIATQAHRYFTGQDIRC